MQDIFLKIVNREIPAHIIWEDEHHLAFLDINPIQQGHTVLIPKQKIDYIFDLSDNDYADLMLAAKQVAIILKDKLGCKRIGVAIEGFLIPHAHIHLVPINSGNELNPEKAKPATKDELEKMYALLTS